MNTKIDSSIYKSAAKEDYISSNYTSAYAKYTRALKNQPNDSTSLHRIFAIRYKQQKYKLAEAKVKKVLIMSPNNARAYCNRGVVLEVLGRYRESEIAYRECIKHDKKGRYVSSNRNLAGVLMKQGRDKEALKVCLKAIKLMEHDGLTYNVLGYIYFLQGEHEKAIENLNKGIELAPEELIIYMNKAIVLWLLERKEEVRSTLEIIKEVVGKIGKRDLKEEIEIYSKELQRLQEQEGNNEDFEGTKRRACIQGIQFILNFIEIELNSQRV